MRSWSLYGGRVDSWCGANVVGKKKSDQEAKKKRRKELRKMRFFVQKERESEFQE
jgi:hypothetical protein